MARTSAHTAAAPPPASAITASCPPSVRHSRSTAASALRLPYAASLRDATRERRRGSGGDSAGVVLFMLRIPMRMARAWAFSSRSATRPSCPSMTPSAAPSTALASAPDTTAAA
ncbi:hypothetical protein OsI_10979 [Oryza sativa Indica Group]|uniref:Uncharacterized protein n=1 Tax=Oryza sativa subsp. indica TaxID=39946 RepID=B8AL19_ORYSI|nr:hypothetical protein OsI_10979 [Oryza sativa Indica Group]